MSFTGKNQLRHTCSKIQSSAKQQNPEEKLTRQAIMPGCTMHRRHTVVSSCVGLSVRHILHIFMSSELQVLKVGQYAKNDILVRLEFVLQGSVLQI